MPIITVPSTLSTPILGDSLDNEIANNRALIINLANGHNDQETRIVALEARSPAVPAPVATIVLTAAMETTLAPLMNATTGQVIILRGTTRDRVVQSL